MTDTLLGILTAARALHDRKPNDPRDCATCIDSMANGIPWPCPTARALGATGWTEWATGRTEWQPTPPPQQCHHTNPNYQTDYPCALPHNHPPVLPNGHRIHIDKDGDTW
jgi:hypothetical protein